MNNKAIRTASIIDLFCDTMITTGQVDITHLYIGSDRGRERGSDLPQLILSEIESGKIAVFPSGVDDPSAIEVYTFPRDTTVGYMENKLIDDGFEEEDVLEMLNEREQDTEAFVSYFIIQPKSPDADPSLKRVMAKLSNKRIAQYHDGDVVEWDINAIEQALEEKTGKTLVFDEYDMNGFPLFIEEGSEEPEEWWVDDKGIIWHGYGRGDNEQIGTIVDPDPPLKRVMI